MRPALAPTVLALVALILAGCAPSEPTQFYTLSGLQLPPGNTAASATTIGIGQVTLPDYLDRPQIVTRAGGNRVTLAEFDSWVEPMDGMFTRVLAENLSLLLTTDDVITLPQRRPIRLDYLLEVDVSRFDADASGRALLDARWWVFDRNGERLLQEGRSTIVETGAQPGDYEAIADAMSEALGGMSREVANAIQAQTAR